MNRQEAVRRSTELVEQMSVEELASQLRFVFFIYGCEVRNFC